MNSGDSYVTDIEAYMSKLGSQARIASREISKASTAKKNTALNAIAEAINSKRAALIESNKKDLQVGAKKGLESANCPHDIM